MRETLSQVDGVYVKLKLYIMNWKNVDLESLYERHRNIIEPLTFDTLLLEISCNIKDITRSAIINQFEIDLQSRIESARDIMLNNLNNIQKDALKYQKLK